MRDVEQLFNKRMNASWVRGIQMFMQIIRNQGAPIIFFGLLIGAAYAYTTFLKGLPPQFPAELLMAFLMALALTKSTVRTFLKEADLVFLLPAEVRMGGYFRSSLVYSGLIQGVVMALVVGAFYPFFRAAIGDDTQFWTSTVVIVLLKLWNVYANWRETLLGTPSAWLRFLRFWSNFLLVYALLMQAWGYGFAAVLLPLLLTLYLLKRRQGHHSYPWNELLATEQKTLATYYTWANYFIDVPQVKNQIKRRAWQIGLVKRFAADHEHPYLFLYARTFFRYSEYYGMYLRLMVFVAVILLFIYHVWIAFGVYLLSLFLMGFQLPMLGGERRYPELIQIYPLNDEHKKAGISRLALGLLIAQSVLLILPLALNFSPLTLLGFLVGGIVFSYYMSFSHLPKRFLRQTQEEDEK